LPFLTLPLKQQATLLQVSVELKQSILPILWISTPLYISSFLFRKLEQNFDNKSSQFHHSNNVIVEI
jgi:hypothetical protein